MTDAVHNQRQNHAIRGISQLCFTALLDTLEAQGLIDMVNNLRAVGQVESVMRRSPAMVGMLIALAWKNREAPMLAGLFTNAAGTVATREDEPIGLCERTFIDIRKSHLLGTARLFLTQRHYANQAKKAVESGFFSRIKALFSRSHGRLQVSKADVNALYNAIKPHLHHQGQFDLIETYATLPLRQINLIGGLLPALVTPTAVKAYAALAAGPAKALIKIAMQFAATVLAQAHLSEYYVATTAAFTNVSENGVDEAVAGYALNKLLSDYSDVIPAIVADEDSALELVRRLAPTAGIDLWKIFRTPAQAVNIRFCPEPLAQVLGNSAAMIHESVSSSLNGAKNLNAMGIILAEILKDMGPDEFAQVADSLAYVKLWDGVVANVNRADNLDSGSDLTIPKAVATLQSITASALRTFHSALETGITGKAA